MALTTEEAAVNTAAIAYITKIEALYAAAVVIGVGTTIQFVPVDVGDSALEDHEYSNNDTTVTTSFNTRVTHEVIAGGEFVIQIPGGNDGSLVPLVWMVTNQAEDLS